MTGVLVDTSVWVDHFRRGNGTLVELLARDLAVCHPLVIGELACGTPPWREHTLRDLSGLRQAGQPSLAEVMGFVEREQLYGLGCGVVDLILLASTLVTPGLSLWTLDRLLSGLSERFGVHYTPAVH